MSDLSRRPDIWRYLAGAQWLWAPQRPAVRREQAWRWRSKWPGPHQRAKRERFAGAPLAEVQQARVEEAYEEAKRVIAAQITTHGRTPRTDWFGDPLHDYVPAAETLELTLIAAAESYERRKVKLLASSLAGLLAFEPGSESRSRLVASSAPRANSPTAS